MLKNSNMFQEQSTIQCSTQSNSVVFYCHLYESDVADDLARCLLFDPDGSRWPRFSLSCRWKIHIPLICTRFWTFFHESPALMFTGKFTISESQILKLFSRWYFVLNLNTTWYRLEVTEGHHVPCGSFMNYQCWICCDWFWRQYKFWMK